MKWKRPTVWSNFFFLVPLIYALKTLSFVSIIAITLLFIFSTQFHLYGKKYEVYDVLAAFGLMSVNTFMFYQSELYPVTFYVGVIFVLIALYVFLQTQPSSLRFVWKNNPRKISKNDFELYHSMWHFFSALITFLSLL